MTQAASQPDSARRHLIARLHESRDSYLRQITRIPETAASFRRNEGSWSILECAEHIAVAERQMLSLWVKLAQEGQTDRALDKMISDAAADRSRKQTAPERARPSGRYATLAEAVRHFSAHREETIAYVGDHCDELRGKTVTHPLFGTMDGFQLVLLMAGHAERHAAQIAEIVSDAAYPGLK